MQIVTVVITPLAVGTFVIFEVTDAHNDCHATLLSWQEDYYMFPRDP